MSKGRRHVFKVRFRVNGKPKSFKTMAKSPSEAAGKLHTKGATIISVGKMHN